MSSGASVALVAGTALLAAVLLTLIRAVRNLSADAKPEAWAQSSAAAEWEEKATKARDDFGLAQIRATAKTWGASIASLLGILGTVAVVAGPDALVDDVGGTEADIAAWLILAAGAIAAVAVLLAILAEQGIPKREDSLDGWAYRSLTAKRADQAAGQLSASRYLVVVALSMILLAAGIAWMAALTGESEPGTQEAIVVTDEGGRCGTLGSADGALALTVGDSVTPIGARAELTLVDSCP